MRTGPLLIVLAALLWGLDGILRRSLYGLSPAIIVFYEHLIGLAILLPFLWKRWGKLSRQEWGAVVFVSLLSGLLGTLWFTTALLKVNFISFSVVFLLQKLQPIFAISAAALILREKISRKFIGWAALALAAAYFVTFPEGKVATGSGETVIAALFAIGAAFAWGTSTAFSRFTLLGHSPTWITGIRFGLTAIFALGFVLLNGHNAHLATVAPAQFGTILLITLSSGLVALWLYYQGLKHTKASVSTILELFYPLIAVIIDIFLYKTTLAPSQYFAAAVLLYAMYRVSLSNREDTPYIADVVPGRGEGRKLGFPTLNFLIPPELSLSHGVYAGWVWIGNAKYPAAIHYGPIPTFGLKEVKLEAHLIDADLKESPAKASFLFDDYLHEIRQFHSLEELVDQLAEDVARVRELTRSAAQKNRWQS